MATDRQHPIAREVLVVAIAGQLVLLAGVRAVVPAVGGLGIEGPTVARFGPGAAVHVLGAVVLVGAPLVLGLGVLLHTGGGGRGRVAGTLRAAWAFGVARLP